MESSPTLDSQRLPDSALRSTLATLRRRKWIVFQTVLLATLAAAIVVLRQEPAYEARSSVIPTQPDLIASPLESSDGAAQRRAQTLADLARMAPVVQRALKSVPGSEATVEEFLQRSSVTARLSSDILDFRVVDNSPQRARALANAYAQGFVAVRKSLEQRALARARRALEIRLADPARAGIDAAGARELRARIGALAQQEALSSAAEAVSEKAATAERIRPRPVRDIALALTLGLILGVGLAFLRDALDTNVRDVRQVGELLGLPLLGSIRAAGRRPSDALVLRDDPAGGEAEAFRILRANLDFANIDRSARTFMVTGAVDGEGRTTTASNLAVALALAGRRVVIADLDLRHPSLSTTFSLEGRPGLTDVVLGHVELDEALTQVPLTRDGAVVQDNGAIGQLCVLPSGPTPIDSGEFVGTLAVASLVRSLGDRADIVLLDSPPLLPVGDARTLSPLADALIVVTNLDLVRRPMLEELRQVLAALPTRVIGFVATGVSPDQHDAYGGYYRRHLRRRIRERTA